MANIYLNNPARSPGVFTLHDPTITQESNPDPATPKLFLGSTALTYGSLFLGESTVSEIYLGTNKVFPPN